MRGPKALLEAESNLVTDMGAWFPGERVVFRGKDLHHDLADLSWMELYLFGITGRRFEKPVFEVLESMWTTTSFPDARLWNNRVVGLSGSSRSTATLGLAAAIAVSEARIYGRGLDIEAIDFLIETRRRVALGDNLGSLVMSRLKSGRRLPGFGRPLTRNDERVSSVSKLLAARGFGDGTHMRLVKEIETQLKRHRLRANYGALCAAFCADIGLSPREYYMLSIPAFSAGMPPCFIAATQNQEAAFLPLSCRSVESSAARPRAWGKNNSGSS